MSRIRSIHPGLWTDDAFMALSAHARLLIIGIWTEAWDDGVFEWKPLTLKARIFPADNVDMAALLAELVDGLFIMEEDFNDRSIGLVRNFRTYQRPKKPNESGMLKPEWRTYVGLSDIGSEPVPHQYDTSSENPPQMEDGGGRMEDEDTSPPPVLVAEEGARDLFDDVWKAFPQNPTSIKADARPLFDRLKAKDQLLVLEAAKRHRQWFTEDNASRKRSEDEGLRFVPHLATWLENGAWRHAGDLPLKSDPAALVVPTVRLSRSVDESLWLACERLMNKRAATSNDQWSFPAAIVAQARKELAH